MRLYYLKSGHLIRKIQRIHMVISAILLFSVFVRGQPAEDKSSSAKGAPSASIAPRGGAPWGRGGGSGGVACLGGGGGGGGGGAACLGGGSACTDLDVGLASTGLLRRLNLSAEQKEALKKTHLETKEQMLKLRQEMSEAQKKFHEALASDASEADLRADHARLNSKRQEMMERRFDQMLSLRRILTPDQKKKMGEWKSSFQDGQMGLRRGRSGFPGRGKGQGGCWAETGNLDE